MRPYFFFSFFFASEFTDLDVNPWALLLWCESPHFIWAFARIRSADFLFFFNHHNTTDKRALKSCVIPLCSKMVSRMCKVCVCVSITFKVWRFPAVTFPSQPSFQYTLKRRWRKFRHIVVRSEAFHCSAPSVTHSIDGCPVSLSRRFRKHQRLSDEVLTKGHRVEAMERRGADYWEREAGEKERETGWSEVKSIPQIQLSEAARS